ncbi:hypothetical protein HK104_003992 [Borealophlyctis nickersoniae]|nr:hypothetical protein HK104_003992 [Borealophlyctis nickersoniae]
MQHQQRQQQQQQQQNPSSNSSPSACTSGPQPVKKLSVDVSMAFSPDTQQHPSYSSPFSSSSSSIPASSRTPYLTPNTPAGPGPESLQHSQHQQSGGMVGISGHNAAGAAGGGQGHSGGGPPASGAGPSFSFTPPGMNLQHAQQQLQAQAAGQSPVQQVQQQEQAGSTQSPQRRRRGDHLSFQVNAGPFFRPTRQLYNIYSIERTRMYTLKINPKVDRGFFIAEGDWTCYRRNYFQVSSAFTATATDGTGHEVEMPCLMEMDGQLHTVINFAIGISSRVANGEKKIDLVQHTPKRDKGPQMVPAPRPCKSGGNPHQYNGIGTNQLVVTFERLQFKTATANNGKRRAAQQYYVLILELYAQCDNGQQYKVATTESAALVVRGRSPGHYTDDPRYMSPGPGDMPYVRRASSDMLGPMAPGMMGPGGYPPMGAPMYHPQGPQPSYQPSMLSVPHPGQTMISPTSPHMGMHPNYPPAQMGPGGLLPPPGSLGGPPHPMQQPGFPQPHPYQQQHPPQHHLQGMHSPPDHNQHHSHTWPRTRTQSMADSDGSYATNTGSASSYEDTIDYDERAGGGSGVMKSPGMANASASPMTPTSGARMQGTVGSPEGTASESDIESGGRGGGYHHHHHSENLHQHHHQHQQQHHQMGIGTVNFSSLPNWADDGDDDNRGGGMEYGIGVKREDEDR